MLFSIILFTMIMLAVSSAAIGLAFYFRRQAERLQSENQKQFKEPPVYRPLFAPTDEELRAFEREAAQTEDEKPPGISTKKGNSNSTPEVNGK